MITSPFSNLYLNAVARITDKAPLIRYVEQDLGQMEHYPEGGRPPVSFPCALIDIEEISFDETGELIKVDTRNGEYVSRVKE